MNVCYKQKSKQNCTFSFKFRFKLNYNFDTSIQFLITIYRALKLKVLELNVSFSIGFNKCATERQFDEHKQYYTYFEPMQTLAFKTLYNHSYLII